jgi:hypothetical protein
VFLPFHLRDEWYFHLRFPSPERIRPVLLAHPPLAVLGKDGLRSGNATVRRALEMGEAQILAWCYEDPEARRGFACTGGHYHSNWMQDDFRKLVVNGILWAAGQAIEPGGAQTTVMPVLRYRTLEEAISRGDTADVRTHLTLDPEALFRPGRGTYLPLHLAVLRQQVGVVSSLLEHGADVDAWTGSHETALHLAMKRGTSAMVETLLKATPSMDLHDRVGWTALHHAAAQGKHELLALMLQSGANVNIRSAGGGTPLHEAAASGNSETVRLLLHHGVDVTLISADGRTARDIAVEFGNQSVLELLD